MSEKKQRKAKTISCPFLDNRTKWLPCQRERCAALYQTGLTVTQLSKIFHVSRRTVEFELFPERRKNSRKGGYVAKQDPERMARYRNRLKEINSPNC